MTPPSRRHAVAVSSESMAHQWARREGAPAGAAVVVDTEISARRRGGAEWRGEDAIAVSIVARPHALSPSASELGWGATGLAAARLLDELVGAGSDCLWPDRVEPGAGPPVELAITAAAALGPGRVDYAILTVRLGAVASLGHRDELAAELVGELRCAARALDEPAALLADYRQRCATIGRAVSVSLLPNGTIQGVATAIDDAFSLVVASPTGLEEAITVPAVRRIDEL